MMHRVEMWNRWLLSALAAVLLLVLLGACPPSAWGQPLNSLPGQPPVVTNGVVLPDPTFQINQLLQAATGSSAVQGYNDYDLLNFLVNTECLEAEFDALAGFGAQLDPALLAGGPGLPAGSRANISAEILPFIQETARDEAGHVRMIREAIGSLASPCPRINITAFSDFFSMAVTGQPASPGAAAFDPFLNDVNLVLAIWTLEEVGSTGDQGVSTLVQNSTLRAAAAGLAVSAGYQAAAQRYILWERRNETVQPFGLSVTDVMQRVSNYRDSLDGPSNIDQGLTFAGGINIVPTDGNGLTYSRTPQQVLSILTMGSSDGRGGFFPNGVNGRINLPTPLTAQFTSTRPGTNYPGWDGTGFATQLTGSAPPLSSPGAE